MELTFEASEGVSEAEKHPGRYSRESTIKQSLGVVDTHVLLW